MAEHMCPLKGLDYPCVEGNCPIWREGEKECGLTTLLYTFISLIEPLKDALTEFTYSKKKERGGL